MQPDRNRASEDASASGPTGTAATSLPEKQGPTRKAQHQIVHVLLSTRITRPAEDENTVWRQKVCVRTRPFHRFRAVGLGVQGSCDEYAKVLTEKGDSMQEQG